MTPELVTLSRRREYERVLQQVRVWAEAQDDVQAVALVGSWARGEARMDSDADVVVLTRTPELYTTTEGWVVAAVGEDVPIVRTMEWTPVIERRVRLGSRFEIEFGFVDPSWASDRPVHPGTAAVVHAGCVAIVDPGGLISGLIAASNR